MTSKKTSKRAFAYGAAILMALMALAGLGAMATAHQPQATQASPETTATANATYSPIGLEPNPVMNTNVTWSTYNASWNNPLTYQSGATQGNTSILNASLSNYYKNPISINPSDIIAPGVLQGNQINNGYWNNTKIENNHYWYEGNAPSNESFLKTISVNGQNAVEDTMNTASTWNNITGYFYPVSPTKEPSNNPAYDYVTMTGYMTATKDINGINGYVFFGNGSAYVTPQNWLTVYPGQSFYFTVNLATLQGSHTGAFTNATSDLSIFFGIKSSQTSTTDTINMVITGMALTTSPQYIGTLDNNGTTQELNYSVGQSTNLNKFAPQFQYTEVTNGGYQVAVSQSIQNITTSQTSINNGQYIEQVTYQGYMEMPNAPDLSYTNTNITMNMAIPGNQYIVANLNGVSFLTEIQALKNGTMNFGVVNPTTQNSIVLEVQFTTSQWNSVSAPPSFWTNPVGAIEYYWYVALGVVLGVVGIGAGIGSKAEGFRAVKK